MINENDKIPFERVLEFAKNDMGFVDLDLSRMSTLFLCQIYKALENKSFNIYSALDEVRHLENLSIKTMTKPATKFQHLPLKGLWHKHFFDAMFVLKNIGNHWGLEYGGNKKLLEMITGVAQVTTDVITDKYVALLADKFVTDALQSRVRNQQITGEWIVYAIKDNENYYLTIASHSEDDVDVYKRIKSICTKEFPGILP